VFYLTKNGCVWPDLPGCFPPWQTVYGYFSKWTADGTWQRISDCLTVDYREKVGKHVQPSVSVIDTQSVKNSPTDFYGLSKRWRIVFFIFCASFHHGKNAFDQFVSHGIDHRAPAAAILFLPSETLRW